MSQPSLSVNPEHRRSALNYGWVVVIVGTLMMAITYGLIYSYSVFFKPLAEYFNWDRATVSGVYSASLIIRGAISIGIGWLADKYGPVKVTAFCGFLIGLGLVLTSQVSTLWQLYVTYAFIEAAGLSGAFGIATAVTSRWFTKNRGLALGIVSSGVGIGTLLIVPGAERLIHLFNWSTAYIIFGSVSGVFMIAGAFFLKSPSPAIRPSIPVSPTLPNSRLPNSPTSISQPEIGLGKAIRSSKMILLVVVFGLIFFCTQMVIVHLVNYATDNGISPLVAATLVSLIGIVSIAGRLIVGVGSDRLGIHNTLILCCVLLTFSMLCLVFTHSLWTLYLFAVLFGFAYGGEVPQIPLLISKYFGTKSMAALIGLLLFAGNIGGALGPWVGGKIFDVTNSYHWAFITGSIAGTGAMTAAWLLKKQSQKMK